MCVVLCVPVLSLSAYFIGQDKEKMPYKYMSLKMLLKSCNKKKMTYEMSDTERALPRYKVWIDQEHLHIVIISRYRNTWTTSTSMQ